MSQLNVETNQSSYLIHINTDFHFIQKIDSFIKNRQIVVITNETIKDIWLEDLLLNLQSSAGIHTVVLKDGEQYKNAESMQFIYTQLLEKHINRDAVLIAFGGGVVGDMAGFAAATYQRGVDFIQIPTTLLSQVDSSVGGKTGINHSLGKNMIGAFKQPKAVFINTPCLKTLPKREVSAGVSEIIKYALINDAEFFLWLENNINDLLALNDDVVAEAILRSCQHKADIVTQDEFESGVRALLNLGHTFGHVIENHLGYGELLHGEAVSIGMLQAAHLSVLQGWLSRDELVRINELLIKAGLPVNPPSIPIEKSLELMSRDKKVKSGNIRLVLLKKIGEAFITDEFNQDLLCQTLQTKILV